MTSCENFQIALHETDIGGDPIVAILERGKKFRWLGHLCYSKRTIVIVRRVEIAVEQIGERRRLGIVLNELVDTKLLRLLDRAICEMWCPMF
jgi:hypothetical protein